MGYPGRNNIYEATIKRMVDRALEEQEAKFSEEHCADTDEELLAYLCQSATRLGHTPWPGEIVGGYFIEQRFGTWKYVLHRAGLRQPSMPNHPSKFDRIQEERIRQEAVYRQKKAEKKRRAQQKK